MSVKPGTQIIENLTSYINEITGGEDSNLSDAIVRLAEGYSSGDVDHILVSSHQVQDVSTFSFSLSSSLLDEYKTISIIPNIEFSKNDWLYFSGFSYDNRWAGSGLTLRYPRIHITKKGDSNYRALLMDNSYVKNESIVNNIITSLLDKGGTYKAYTSGVLMNGTIDIYGTNFDLDHFLEDMKNVLLRN